MNDCTGEAGGGSSKYVHTQSQNVDTEFSLETNNFCCVDLTVLIVKIFNDNQVTEHQSA